MVGPLESSRSPRLPAPEAREPVWLLALQLGFYSLQSSALNPATDSEQLRVESTGQYCPLVIRVQEW